MILLITQLIQIGFFILLVIIIFAFMQRLQYKQTGGWITIKWIELRDSVFREPYVVINKAMPTAKIMWYIFHFSIDGFYFLQLFHLWLWICMH